MVELAHCLFIKEKREMFSGVFGDTATRFSMQATKGKKREKKKKKAKGKCGGGGRWKNE